MLGTMGSPFVPHPPTAVKMAQARAQREKAVDLPVFKSGFDLLGETPEMAITENVKVKGDLKFENLLRIDGTVEGTIAAPPKAGMIIGEAGTLLGNILGLGCLLVEGKVLGNINVESLTLAETAVVHGDISCRSMECSPSATLIGQLHISAFEPLAVIDKEGKIDTSATFDPNKVAALAPPKKKVILFLLDPQVDFHPGGSCPIPNAQEDAERIAELITQNVSLIDEIYVTLDTHHRMHIAHSIFWTDEGGKENPPPYTTISLADVEAGKWVPKNKAHLQHCKFYLRELEIKGKGMSLTVKPEHCLIGTLGHSVVPCINEALQEWATQRLRKISYVPKGHCCLTDFSSALIADVEIRDDPTTYIDPILLGKLNAADRLIVCGQSLSHTVNYTMRDLLSHWKKEPSKLALLKDGSSANPDLDPGKFDSEKFWNDMNAAGVMIARSAEVLLDLQAEALEKAEKG